MSVPPVVGSSTSRSPGTAHTRTTRPSPLPAPLHGCSFQKSAPWPGVAKTAAAPHLNNWGPGGGGGRGILEVWDSQEVRLQAGQLRCWAKIVLSSFREMNKEKQCSKQYKTCEQCKFLLELVSAEWFMLQAPSAAQTDLRLRVSWVEHACLSGLH